MKDINKRVASAAICVPLLLLIFYLGGIYFLVFISVVSLLSLIEFFNLISLNISYKRRVYIILISIILIVMAYFNSFYLTLSFTLLIIISVLFEFRGTNFSNCIPNLGLILFSSLYFGWTLAHAVLLRIIGGIDNINIFAVNNQGLSDPGFFLIVLVVACTFLNDTGAFFVGNIFGKSKLAPHISPGKTIEGTIGGILLTIVVSICTNLIFSNPISIYWAIIFAIVISLSAIAGDLFESVIKRGAGVKDSGSIIPGHGGFLDRFDSLILVFPCSYYLSIIFYYYSGVLVF